MAAAAAAAAAAVFPHEALNFFQWTLQNGETIQSPNAPTRENSQFNEINELVLLRPPEYFESFRQKLLKDKGTIGLGEFAVFKN
jgi:hypothetical protein